MTKRFILMSIAAVSLAAATACTTHNNDAPGLTGPSGLSTAITSSPVANFQILPNPIDLSRQPDGGIVTFDATASCGVQRSENGTCSSPVASFQFVFSDGTTGSGPIVVRRVSDDAIGTISAILVVTNNQGAASSTTRSAQVLRSPPPKASGTFVPNPAVLSAAVGGSVTVLFADTSTVTPPRVIRSWVWDFLDGRPTTGSTAQHVFTSVGTFPVVLTVTDDLGQQSQTTLAVVVTAPAVVNPTPVLAGAGTTARGRH